MAYDGWVELDGTEFINISRTAQLAEALGIDTVWVDPAAVAWIDDVLGGVNYNQITAAPWYDSGTPASAEFAGVLPLSLVGLDDSTLEASTIENITNGGAAGKARNRSLVIVANTALIASTERGADYGKRWLDSRLRAAGARSFCSGTQMRYFQYPGADGEAAPPKVHRRDVSLTRGTGVTRKSSTPCAVTWIVGFTWTAGDPFEYSEEFPQMAALGGLSPTGPSVVDSGVTSLAAAGCPVYDYSPIFDPDYPALVPAPAPPDIISSVPNVYVDGTMLDRYWVELEPFEPSVQRVVPVLTLTSDTDARLIRICAWEANGYYADQCDPLWMAMVAYLPGDVDFIIDGEQEAIYAWDRVSEGVRRADSLVYGDRGRPVQWTSLQAPEGILFTMDTVDGSDGGGTVRLSVSFVAKSD